MGGDQRGVQVNRQPVRRADQFPHPGPRVGVRRAQRIEQTRRGRDPVDHPERGGRRRRRPEQNGLIANRSQIGQTVTAVGEHHRQIPNHPTAVMAAGPQPRLPDRDRQRPRQPRRVRDLG